MRSRQDCVQRTTRQGSIQIAIRLAEADVAEARKIAERKGIGYRTLLKTLVREAIDDGLYALPKGRITGHVIGPEGKPLRPATVNLYRASRYKAEERGIWSCQCDWGPMGG
jgi:hypothetical protein